VVLLLLTEQILGFFDLVITSRNSDFGGSQTVVGKGECIRQLGLLLCDEVLTDQDAANHTHLDAEAFGTESAVRGAQQAVCFHLAPGGVYIGKAGCGECDGAPHPALLGLFVNAGFFFEVAGMFNDFSKAQVGGEGSEYGKHQ